MQESREAGSESAALELRRIERDLHDGAQQRLVALAMDLGMARTKLDRDPAGVRELLDVELVVRGSTARVPRTRSRKR